MRGIEVLLEILAGSGVRAIFGNPGSTELPLNAALAADDRFRYVLGLQEIPVMAMADGYAMASGGLGVVCLHICAGLGNAMGMLYNAHCEGTPMLILAGQQDRRLRMEEPVLAGDMVRVARPWTRWAVEVDRIGDLPVAVRRAVQVALTPPTGPVFLSLPLDLQLEETDGLDLTPARVPDRRVRPPLAAVTRAAGILARADNPVVLAGSRVVEAGAVTQLAELAELLGAPVFAEQQTSHGRLPLPSDHPLYAGCLPLEPSGVRRRLDGYDVVLAVGIDLLRPFLYDGPTRAIPEPARLIHLDANSREVGKNYPVEVALLGDPQAGLAELVQMVSDIYPAGQREAAALRRERWAARRRDHRESLLARIDREWERRPMTPLAMMGALARAIPGNAAVVEEAVTSHHNVLARLGVLRDPTGHFAQRGWALGWGLGCAVGVKLAWPDRPVLALLGDGAALYGIQGLWSAAHYHVPVTWVIANNAQYLILKQAADMLSLPRMQMPGLDLVEPEVDFVNLARSLGVEAHRVIEPDELTERVSRSFQRTEPLLLDVPIER